MERNACSSILEQSDFVFVVVGRRSRDLLEEATGWKAGKVDWRPGPARARQVHGGVAGGDRVVTTCSRCPYQQAQEARGQGRVGSQCGTLPQGDDIACLESLGDAQRGTIGRRRIALSLRWLRAILLRRRGTLQRSYHPDDGYAAADLDMEFDTSPWGLGGGVLYFQGKPQRWFSDPIHKLDVKRFMIEMCKAKDQALLEGLPMLVGVRLWARFCYTRKWAVYL